MAEPVEANDGESYSGSKIEQKRQWYGKRRKALQSVGTRSAKRRLKQLRGRQARFQKDSNHQISKRLVAKAERTKRAIGVEELTGIRQRANRRSQSHFCCVVCGHTVPADYNAALNIRNRATCQIAYGVQPSG